MNANQRSEANTPESIALSPIDMDRQNTVEAAFPIVGIVASAGGLEAFTELLQHLPADTGMAFVLIQHLDPNYKSLLKEILATKTQMSVSQVEDGTTVEPNQVL